MKPMNTIWCSLALSLSLIQGTPAPVAAAQAACQDRAGGGVRCQLGDLLEVNTPPGWTFSGTSESSLEFRGPEPGLSMVVRIAGGPETPDTYAAAAARRLALQEVLTVPVIEVEMSEGKRLRTSLYWVAQDRVAVRQIWPLSHGAVERDIICAAPPQNGDDPTGTRSAVLQDAIAAVDTMRGSLIVSTALATDIERAVPAPVRARLSGVPARTEWVVSRRTGVRALLTPGMVPTQDYVRGHFVLSFTDKSTRMPLLTVQDWRTNVLGKKTLADKIEERACEKQKKCRITSRTPAAIHGVPALLLTYEAKGDSGDVYVFETLKRVVWVYAVPELHPGLAEVLQSIELFD